MVVIILTAKSKLVIFSFYKF